jgi:tetratricopeptide (TPR) repeat protein
MTPIRHVTAAIVLTAFATAGCSKSGETLEATAAAESIAKPVATDISTPSTTPVTRGGSSTPVVDGESAAAVIPKIAGLISFGDGEAAYRARHYNDATAIFEHYTAQRPNNPWGHYMLGLSAWKVGDLVRSEQAFEKALSVDPQHVKSLLNLSRVFIEQKRHDDAIDRLTRAADLDPESIQVHRLLGRTYHTLDKTGEAEAAYRHAIELNELDAWSMNNLGLLFFETGRADAALPLLSRAVELKPEVPAFHNNLGMALEHTGRFKDAAAAYQGALAADPNYEKAKRHLARIEALLAERS